MVLPGILYPIFPILSWFGGKLGIWTIVKGVTVFVPLGTKVVIAAKTTTAAAAAAKTVTVAGGLGWGTIGWMMAF